jgi:deoxyadenosine/deoxycytidine kinase
LLTCFRGMLTRMQQSKRQAEDQLREREEQYRSIFEATYDALMETFQIRVLVNQLFPI